MTYEETLEALNDSSRKCMRRKAGEKLNYIKAKCPELYKITETKIKKIVEEKNTHKEDHRASVYALINDTWQICKDQVTSGPPSLTSKQQLINELNKRRQNGRGRRTRKHKRSQHKRSQHKRSTRRPRK